MGAVEQDAVPGSEARSGEAKGIEPDVVHLRLHCARFGPVQVKKVEGRIFDCRSGAYMGIMKYVQGLRRCDPNKIRSLT